MAQRTCNQLGRMLGTPCQRPLVQGARAIARQRPEFNFTRSQRWQRSCYSTQPETAADSQPGPSEAAETAAQDQQATFDKNLKDKDSEIAKLKDSLLHSMADFQNLQKNSAREKANAKDYAVTKFAEDLVSNIDVLKIALDSVPEAKRTPSEANGDAADLQTLWQGVAMMMGELEKTLGRHGIKPFDPIGEKFDPNRHEALFQTDVPDKEPGTVFMTQRKGWTIKDRLLRPAEVGVVKQKDA